MATPVTFKAPFCYGAFYHLIFKSIGDVLLFRCHDNKLFFLERFSFFLQPFCNNWAWVLLDNHAHFITRIRTAEDIYQHIISTPEESRTISMKKILADYKNESFQDELIERQVNRFMVSYANAFNNMYKRKGGLFQSPFRRSVITGDAHLQQAIIYVHANAQKHGLVHDYRQYKYSSYHEIVNGNDLLADRMAIMDFFGGKEQFIEQHNMQVDYYYTGDE